MTPCRYKKALQKGVRACNNLPQPSPYILVFGGCVRLLHALTPLCSAFLYLQFFCTVSSIHPTEAIIGTGDSHFLHMYGIKSQACVVKAQCDCTGAVC